MPVKSQTITVAGYDAARLQAIAYGALEQLGWTIKYAGDNILLAYTPRGWNKYDNEITVNTEDNQLSVTSKMIHGEAFDMLGRNKKHIAEFVAAFETVKAKATDLNTGEWNAKIELLKGETLIAAEQEVKQAAEVDKVMNLSKGNLYVTYSIIAINALVFVAMVVSGISLLSPNTLDILKWGGNLPLLTFGGDWWRLASCMFIHIGIIHLLLNMYALYSVSVYLEPMLGKTRYIAAYLCSGLLSSLVSVLWHKADNITSAGASGAIFGMYGVFLALLTTNVIPKEVRKSILQSILIFVGYNIFYGFKPGSGIDNSAHLGGLVSGMAIGYIYYFGFKQPSEKKTQTITGLVGLATILILFSVLRNEKTAPVTVDYKTGAIYNKPGDKFEEKLLEFGLLEVKATSPESDSLLTPEQRLEKFEQESVPAWEEASKVADELKSVASTEKQGTKASKLKEYVDLRKEIVKLKIKALKENSNQYDEQVYELINRSNKLVGSLDQQ
jgi:rhomboid protease GluP